MRSLASELRNRKSLTIFMLSEEKRKMQNRLEAIRRISNKAKVKEGEKLPKDEEAGLLFIRPMLLNEDVIFMVKNKHGTMTGVKSPKDYSDDIAFLAELTIHLELLYDSAIIAAENYNATLANYHLNLIYKAILEASKHPATYTISWSGLAAWQSLAVGDSDAFVIPAEHKYVTPSGILEVLKKPLNIEGSEYLPIEITGYGLFVK